MKQPFGWIGSIAVCLLIAIGAATFWNGQQLRRYQLQESETLRLLGVLQSRELREVSGLALSQRHPDCLWMHNDSGAEPELFLVSQKGQTIARFLLEGAANVDWEDISGWRLPGKPPGLMVADVGDNGRLRETCSLYFLAEPEAESAREFAASPDRPLAIKDFRQVGFRYAEGPRNCEAVAFDSATQSVLLAEKIAGNETSWGEPGLYQLDLRTWFATAEAVPEVAVAERIGTLPVHNISAMDISADGRQLVFRNYASAFLLERGADQTWAARFAEPLPEPLDLPVEAQGEAICFSADARSVITTSEFAFQPLWKLQLPEPGDESSRRTTTQELSSEEEIKSLILPGEAFRFEGRAAFIFWPPAALRSRPQPWVFYAPTLPAYPDSNELWLHQQLTAAGVAVVGIDAGEAYGSPESRQLFDRFYQELVDRRGFSPRPCLLGRSRGGLWVTSWAADHPDRFSGLAGIYPVLDWTTYPGTARTAASYGCSEKELLERAAEWNPIARAGVLAQARLPVFLIHGDQDDVVPLAPNSAALAAAYETAGAAEALTLIIAPGQGHNLWEGFFKSQPLVDFVIARARDQ